DKEGEKFFTTFKVLAEEGYLKVANHAYGRKGEKSRTIAATSEEGTTNKVISTDDPDQNGVDKSCINKDNTDKDGIDKEGIDKDAVDKDGTEEIGCDMEFMSGLSALKKGAQLPLLNLEIKEGETTPPKRYNSGTMILTMENAGQFIEDDELRAQIKGSGIGTSATRAEILKKLVTINYLALNKKTQIITPTLMGEMIYDIVNNSIKPLLDPALTASWEKGLNMVADGTITEAEYMTKLTDFIARRTNYVKQTRNQEQMYHFYEEAAAGYKLSGK
ncbi:MAG: type IA DNA topoisomerase, partial [Lachnospiraceae bacterium]|nr:type IA DNA topoisomerase [Lachnospiraceae bacterium]